TPDMRGLMPIGAGGSVALGQAVGSATSTTTSSGSHNHGGATQSHALTEAQIPPHKHLSNATKLLESSPNGSVDTNGATQWEFHDFRTLANPYTSTVGGGAGHSHGLSSDGAHTHTVAVAPPARGLYFIMRVS